jgi:predicted nucleotidyltransferase
VIILKKLEPDLLNEIVQRLVNALHPEKIYLFGSHAYGQPNDDSDVDLLIVINDSDTFNRDKIVEGYRALWGLRIPKDIVVVTQSQFDKRSRWLSSIERVVIDKGKLLYDSRS